MCRSSCCLVLTLFLVRPHVHFHNFPLDMNSLFGFGSNDSSRCHPGDSAHTQHVSTYVAQSKSKEMFTLATYIDLNAVEAIIFTYPLVFTAARESLVGSQPFLQEAPHALLSCKGRLIEFNSRQQDEGYAEARSWFRSHV